MNKNYVYVKGKVLFSIFLIAFLLISINKVNVATASLATHFYVDPPEVTYVPLGDSFLVNMSVADADETYAWEGYISWNSTLLELVTVEEGDFLHRGGLYETTFTRVPVSLDAANVAGQIRLGCNLKYDVPWASGEGWLATLNFTVTAEGSSVLNLFDTRLWDHMLAGSPAYTYHPNLDGFFYNTLFHDIVITSITASPTVVIPGESVGINVTVTNEGNYTETSETFNVTVYADTEVYKDIIDLGYDPNRPIRPNTIVVGDEVIVGTTTLTESLGPGANTTLTFTWDTADVAGGNYTISAEVKGDDDTRNNLFIDETVSVLAHDIAIINVVPSPTEVTVGKNVTIEVIVENKGSFNETFNVTVYYDDTVIDTETGVFLERENSTILTFTWNTTDVAEGTYTIKAEASVVGGDERTENNIFEDGTVKVRGAAAPDILLYAAVAIVIIIGAAIAVYFIWFRKPT